MVLSIQSFKRGLPMMPCSREPLGTIDAGERLGLPHWRRYKTQQEHNPRNPAAKYSHVLSSGVLEGRLVDGQNIQTCNRLCVEPLATKSPCFNARVGKSDFGGLIISSIGAKAPQVQLTLNFGGEGVVLDGKGLNSSIYGRTDKVHQSPGCLHGDSHMHPPRKAQISLGRVSQDFAQRNRRGLGQLPPRLVFESLQGLFLPLLSFATLGRMSKTIFKTIMMWHSWHTSVLFLDVCRIVIFVT